MNQLASQPLLPRGGLSRRGIESALLVAALSLLTFALAEAAAPRPHAWLLVPAWLASTFALGAARERWRWHLAPLLPAAAALVVAVSFSSAAAIFASPLWWAVVIAQAYWLTPLEVGGAAASFSSRSLTLSRRAIWPLLLCLSGAATMLRGGVSYQADAVNLAILWSTLLWLLAFKPLGGVGAIYLQTQGNIAKVPLYIAELIALLAWVAVAPYILYSNVVMALTLSCVSLATLLALGRTRPPARALDVI